MFGTWEDLGGVHPFPEDAWGMGEPSDEDEGEDGEG